MLDQASGRVPVVIGTAAPATGTAVALTRHAREIGAAGVIAMPPYVVPLGPDGVLDYYTRIAEAADGLPVVLQNVGGQVGVPMRADAVVRLAEAVPSIRYVKEETLPSTHRISELLRAAGDRLDGVFGGSGGRCLVDELLRGACGLMSGCQLVDAQVKVYDLLQAGDEDGARAAFVRQLPAQTLWGLVGLKVAKEMLRRRGVFRTTVCRKPDPDLDEHDLAELDHAMALAQAGPRRGGSGMKITGLRVLILEPRENHHQEVPEYVVSKTRQNGIAIISTDEGSTASSRPRPATPGSLRGAGPGAREHIEGQDPFDRGKIARTLRRRFTWPQRILGVLDYGLWDIAGKAFDKPIYKLLGATREKILAYGSTIHHNSDERFIETTLRCKEAGFKAVKLHPYCNFEDDLRLVYKVRKAVGDDLTLMIDTLVYPAPYTRDEAMRMGRALDELGFWWFEDPLPKTDLDGLAELTRECKVVQIRAADRVEDIARVRRHDQDGLHGHHGRPGLVRHHRSDEAGGAGRSEQHEDGAARLRRRHGQPARRPGDRQLRLLRAGHTRGLLRQRDLPRRLPGADPRGPRRVRPRADRPRPRLPHRPEGGREGRLRDLAAVTDRM